MKLQLYTWNLVVLPNEANFLAVVSPAEGPVDQLGRLPPSQGGGRGFKSRPVHHRGEKCHLT